MKTATKAKKKKTPLELKPIKKKSIAPFFGIDKNEEDGLKFQKRVRNEWN